MSGAARSGYLVAIVVFLVDQFTKWLAAGPLGLVERLWVPVLPMFDLRYLQNYGVSMGFLVADSERGRWLLVLMTGAIAAGVAVWLWRERTRGDAVALGAVLGGALGNILDRVRLGYVFDFLDLHVAIPAWSGDYAPLASAMGLLRIPIGGDWHPFLVFNVADAAITLGVAALLLRAFIARPARDAQGEY